MEKIVKYVRTSHLEGSRLQDGDHDLAQVLFSSIRGQHLVIEEKIDGCVSGNTLIDTLEYGEISIQEIVEKKLDCHVLAFDAIRQEACYSKILEHFISNEEIQWYEIELADGRVIQVTANHLFYLPDLHCYRRADELSVDDIALILEKD